jgi:hypothetical protein
MIPSVVSAACAGQGCRARVQLAAIRTHSCPVPTSADGSLLCKCHVAASATQMHRQVMRVRREEESGEEAACMRSGRPPLRSWRSVAPQLEAASGFLPPTGCRGQLFTGSLFRPVGWGNSGESLLLRGPRGGCPPPPVLTLPPRPRSCCLVGSSSRHFFDSPVSHQTHHLQTTGGGGGSEPKRSKALEPIFTANSPDCGAPAVCVCAAPVE